MKWRIAYITDIHLDEQFPKELGVDARKNWETILKDLESRDIDEIIFGGDIGVNDALDWFFGSLYNQIVTLTLGNHDQYSAVSEFYNGSVDEDSGELYYCREDDYIRRIYLDSSSDAISKGQLEWLENQLDPPYKIVLFIHHPVLAVDTEIDRQFPLKNRDAVKSVLVNSGRKIQLFCGHYHMEDYRTEGKIQQYITPASSFQTEQIPNELKFNSSIFGYRIIEFNDDQIDTELVMFKSS